MVKLNQKSKRLTCKRRYRIEKRIKAHNKNEAKKAIVKQKRSKSKTMVIPNKFPMKEELLEEAEKQKEAALQEKARIKEEKKKIRAENKLKGFDENLNGPLKNSLDNLVKQAQKKQDQFNTKLDILEKSFNPFDDTYRNSNKNVDKEQSLKSFYKEFKKVTEAADVLIEVLDARDPMGSRCPQVEDMIINSGKDKKLVLLLNKIDLVPKENIQAWLKYLRGSYPTVAFKSSTQNQNERLKQSSVRIDQANQGLLTSSQCLGADILMKLLNNYTRTKDIKQTITVGIIGLPNVGKSSVINSLKRSHACMIGSTPGLTKQMQEIKLDKHIKLLDCPGIVMSKEEDSASLALKNCLKIETLDDPTGPVDLLLKRCNKDQLITNYKITDFSDVHEFLVLVAKRCGKIKKNGIPDIRKAAQLILNDWTSGKLTYYTSPPEIPKVSDTKIVTELSAGFDIDALFKEETSNIERMDDTRVLVDGLEIKPTDPFKINFDELEKDSSDEEIEEDSDEEVYELNDDEMEEDKEENDKKGVVFKSDVVLNTKQARKNKAAADSQPKNDDYTGMTRQRQTTDRMNLRKKMLKDDADIEKEIYNNADIPRTKKTQKAEMKKKNKKMRKNERLVSNLGDLMSSTSIKNK